MTRLDDLLSTVFYRRACPAAETLGDYHLGRSAPGERLGVALHLRECPLCPAELALYAAEPPRSPVGQALDDFAATARGALASLVSRVAWPVPVASPALAPAVRGAANVLQTYRSDDVEVVLEEQPAPSGYRRRRLVGNVAPPKPAMQIELWSTTGLLESLALGHAGFFVFDRLKLDTYFLCLRQDETEIWLEVGVGARA